MDITNKAVKISRAICSIEESLANGDLLAREADDLRIELDELREWDDLLNAYFTARSNGEKLQAERDALVVQMMQLGKLHSDLTNADMVLDDGEHSGYLITSEQLEDMERYLTEPILCLAAHDAEVAKKAVQAALRMYGNADLNNKEIIALSESYAASLNK